jgi:DNA-binding SARP family transcriptional activator
MTLLSGTGRRRQAVQVYEALCGALREVVGVAPEAETVALYRRIAGGEGTGPGS